MSFARYLCHVAVSIATCRECKRSGQIVFVLLNMFNRTNTRRVNRTEQNKRCYEQTISPPQPREHQKLPNLGHFGKIRPQDECWHADFLSPTSSIAIILISTLSFLLKMRRRSRRRAKFLADTPQLTQKGTKTLFGTEQNRKQTDPP